MDPNIEFLPGPIDPAVLYEQKNHISNEIWKNDSEFKFTTHNHDHFPTITNGRVLDYVTRAGFYGLYRFGFSKVNVSLISALVERWRGETPSFHFPVGECTVTLHDVEILCGVRVTGMPVIRSEKGEDINDRQELFHQLLGVRLHYSHFTEQGSINANWLKENFQESDLNADTPDEIIQHHERAAVLRILGSSFIQNKQGSAWPMFILPFLRDFDMCGQYSWGSAILAFLYRNLYKASVGLKGINGALSLLQIWAWTRLPQIRPCDELPAEVFPIDGRPRSPYGCSDKDLNAGGHGYSLRVYRDEFDKMQPSRICWEPYKDVWNELPSCFKEGEPIWLAEVPLIFIDKVEKHYPDRVKRQFGLKQDVPPPPSGEDYTLHRLSRTGHAAWDWPKEHRKYVRQWEDIFDCIVAGEHHDGRETMTDDYMPWYQKITRRWIGPLMIQPLKRGSQRTAGLVDLLFRWIVSHYHILNEMGHSEGLTSCKQLFALAGVDVPVVGDREPPTFSQRPSVPHTDSPPTERPHHRRQGQRQSEQSSAREDVGMDVEQPVGTPTPPTGPIRQPVPYGGWYPTPFVRPPFTPEMADGYFTPYMPGCPPIPPYPTLRPQQNSFQTPQHIYIKLPKKP